MQTITGTSVHDAARFLLSNEIVAIPTETVYGLAANALNADAVLKIFIAKNRPSFDPLIVHIHSIREAYNYAEVSAQARQLMDEFWPGPLTILLPRKQLVPDIVTSGLDTVGLRMPSHPLILELLKLLPFPLAAPSANPFGYISPTTAKHVADQLAGKISYILDGGPSKIGVESTIVTFINDILTVHRLGGITLEQLKQNHPLVRLQLSGGSNPAAPGMLDAHYAPRKKLLFGKAEQLVDDAGEGAVILCLQRNPAWSLPVCELSPAGNLEEAAGNLFAALRMLDDAEYKIIIADRFPDQHLGLAINDRLKRASVNK